MKHKLINWQRWRPRWSVRILLIVVTLICAYLACWGPTKGRGVDNVRKRLDIHPPRSALSTMNIQYHSVVAAAPLIVKKDDFIITAGPNISGGGIYVRQYYFWFFGYVAKLPYERELPLSIEDGERPSGGLIQLFTPDAAIQN